MITFNIRQVLTPENIGGLGATTIDADVSVGQAFGIEFFITFVLVLVVFAAAADANNAVNVKGSAPLAIGLSITTCHLFAVSSIKMLERKKNVRCYFYPDPIYRLKHEPSPIYWTSCNFEHVG